MIENKKIINIGYILNFSYASWIGGFNYHLNLFKCLKKYNKKINIIIFVNSNISKHDLGLLKDYKVIKTNFFDYSYTCSKLRKMFSKIKIFFFGRDIAIENFLKKHHIDVISHSIYLGKKSSLPSIPIIYDFQELYNPQYFTYKDIFFRKINYWMVSKHADKVILGGNHALLDYQKIIKKPKNNGFVLSQPYFLQFKLKSKKHLFKKYKIDNPRYFLLPNQYWRHKNHIIVLKALKFLAIKKKINFLILSTGNTNNWRDKNYFKEIKLFIKKNNIQNYKILGVINHDDLIGLAYYSHGIINPSKSEGWSNSVELGKALNKNIFLSNINCHKEQADKNSFLFNSNDFIHLSELLTSRMTKRKDNLSLIKKKLNQRVLFFGKKYFELIYKQFYEKKNSSLHIQ